MEKMYGGLDEKIARLQWLWHKRQLRDHSMGGPMANPMRGQGRILAVLKMQDGLSTKDLSFLLGLRVSSLNELLAKLEKNGYIIREPSDADKRVMLVRLTQKGRDEQPRESDIDDVFACLSEDEQKTLGGILDRVIAALEVELGAGPDDEFEWMRGARNRMGDELFERFASMRHGGYPFRGGFDPRDRFGRHRHGGFTGSGPGPRPEADPRQFAADWDE